MKCDQIQELLLTDYLDGVIEEDVRKKVDSHIEACPMCQKFKTAAVRTVDLFSDLEKKESPRHLWTKIESALEQHPLESIAVPWWEQLKSWLVNPIPVIAMFIVIFLVAGAAVNRFQDREAKLNQQSKEFLVSVMNSSSSVLINDEDDFGTNEELYFL